MGVTAARIDALLDAMPDLTTRQLWEQIVDHTDLKVSYSTVSPHHKKATPQAQPHN